MLMAMQHLHLVCLVVIPTSFLRECEQVRAPDTDHTCAANSAHHERDRERLQCFSQPASLTIQEGDKG